MASSLFKFKKPLLSVALLIFCQYSFASATLQHWQQASINWQSKAGSHINILADEQPAFMALKPYIPLFEQLTGISVGFHALEQSQMRVRRHQDLSEASGLYDVLPMGITFLGEAQSQGWVEPLQPYIDNPKLTDKTWYQLEDISERSLALCKIDNTLYSLPFDFSAPIYFYRKDLFERFNLAVPDTYEQLQATKVKLQREIDRTPSLNGMHAFASRTLPGAGLNTWTVLPVMRAYGAEVIDAQGQSVFNSPETAQSLQVYRDLVTGFGNPDNSRLLHFYEIRRLFKEGRLASAFLASHFYNEIDTAEESDIWNKWEAAPLPAGPIARETSPWAWAFAINSKSTNKDAAWLFIQWATSEQTAALLSTGGSPPRQKVWHEKLFTLVNKPGFNKAMLWVFEHATPDRLQAGMVEFPVIGEIISQTFSQIFYGADIKQSIKSTDAKINANMQALKVRSNIEQ